MTGWLIVNHFLNQTPKFLELTDWFSASARKQKIHLTTYTNLELLLQIDRLSKETLPDFVLFWDKDIRLARMLEGLGLRLFNCASAIEACDDKSLTYALLCHSDIRMPKTLISPMVYTPVSFRDTSFPDTIRENFHFPLILKEAYGSFGEQVYLISSEEELLKQMDSMKTKPFLIQEFVETSCKRDIRIQVVGKKAVAAMYRYSDTSDFRANISHGGKMKYYEPDAKQISLAVRACEALSLDFAGVDLLFGENDEPVLCEVNSNAHFVNIHSVTNVNVPDHIFEHIRASIEERR